MITTILSVDIELQPGTDPDWLLNEINLLLDDTGAGRTIHSNVCDDPLPESVLVDLTEYAED